MPGQFLERPALIPVGELVLEGLSHRGTQAPPLLIVPPPPLEGGMDHVVCAEVAWAAAMAGHATLRFNFRGVGASQGARDATTNVDDAYAALTVLLENTALPAAAVLTVGGSAKVGLELVQRHATVGGIALVAPRDIDASQVHRVSAPLLVLSAQQDERVPRAAWAAAVSEAGGGFEIIEGADASFQRSLPLVGKSVVRWLASLGGQVREST